MLRQVSSIIYVLHMMNFTRLPKFSARVMEKLSVPWYEANSYVGLNDITKLHQSTRKLDRVGLE